MKITRTKATGTIVAAAAAALLLAGCATGTSTGSSSSTSKSTSSVKTTATPQAAAPKVAAQTKEEACALMTAGISNAQSSLGAGLSDPNNMVNSMKTIVAGMNDANSKITNTDVKPVAQAVVDGYNSFMTVLQGLADGSATISDLSPVSTQVQTAVANFTALCGPLSTTTTAP